MSRQSRDTGIEGVDIKWERFFNVLEGRVNTRVGSLASLLRLLEAIENTTEGPI
jgi:hypothetical protein